MDREDMMEMGEESEPMFFGMSTCAGLGGD